MGVIRVVRFLILCLTLNPTQVHAGLVEESKLQNLLSVNSYLNAGDLVRLGQTDHAFQECIKPVLDERIDYWVAIYRHHHRALRTHLNLKLGQLYYKEELNPYVTRESILQWRHLAQLIKAYADYQLTGSSTIQGLEYLSQTEALFNLKQEIALLETTFGPWNDKDTKAVKESIFYLLLGVGLPFLASERLPDRICLTSVATGSVALAVYAAWSPIRKIKNRMLIREKKKKLEHTHQKLQAFFDHPELADPSLMLCGLDYPSLNFIERQKLGKEVEALSEEDPVLARLFQFFGLKYRTPLNEVVADSGDLQQ